MQQFKNMPEIQQCKNVRMIALKIKTKIKNLQINHQTFPKSPVIPNHPDSL